MVYNYSMENIKEKSFGIVPVFKDLKGDIYFCLVRQSKEYWGFPKGHGNEGEDSLDTARRELMEETGITDIDILKDKSFIENYTFEKDGVTHNKIAEYFIGFTNDIKTNTHKDFQEEILEIKWASFNEAKNLITFPEAREILNEIIEYLK